MRRYFLAFSVALCALLIASTRSGLGKKHRRLNSSDYPWSNKKGNNREGRFKQVPFAAGASPGMPEETLVPDHETERGLPETPEKTDLGNTLPALNDSSTTPPGPDLEKIEEEQGKLEETLQNIEETREAVGRDVKDLKRSSNAAQYKDMDLYFDVVKPQQVEETEALEKIEKAAKMESEFTAPIVVLLPTPPTPRDKLEFARALKCMRSMNTPEMRSYRKAKLSEMSRIKGKTNEEIEKEMKETDNELQKVKATRRATHEKLRKAQTDVISGKKVRADVLFFKEELKDLDKQISVLLDKLKRLNSRQQGLNLETKEAEDEEKSEAESESGEEEGKGKQGEEEQKRKAGIFHKMKSLFKRQSKKNKEEAEEEE